MAKAQKQVCDIRPGKRMTVAQSNEHLRIGENSAWNAKRAGTLDPTRSRLNFEITKGGVVSEVNQKKSIPKRIAEICKRKGMVDPNKNYTDEQLEKSRIGQRTYANLVLYGTNDTMRSLAFGDQEVNYERGADNSHVKRLPGIEEWAKDIYNFLALKYGEENIACFVAHLDESNPHVHCTLLCIGSRNKFDYMGYFGGKYKWEASEKMKKLHSELSEVNRKYGLQRGQSTLESGAEHKSYLQWLQEQISDSGKTLEERRALIKKIDSDIHRAEIKLKGLNTMIENLETKKDIIERELMALDEKVELGELSVSDVAAKQLKLSNDLKEIEQKLQTRRQQLQDVQHELDQVTGDRRRMILSYEEVTRNLNKAESDFHEKELHKMTETAWAVSSQLAKDDLRDLHQTASALPPGQREEMESILDESVLQEMAQRGDEIIAVATALSLGYIESATTFAETHGGGGGSPGSGWGRDDDEDDEMWRRRCFIMGRSLMRPAGRKLRKSK